MDLSSLSNKQCNDLEQQLTELLKTMRKAKLQQYPLYTSLQELEQALCEARRNRYDKNTSKYVGY